MTQLKGIDVAHWNGNIDWPKVKADGVKFAFIKATEGTSYSKVDYFRNQAPKALGVGIDVGAYHYAKFGSVAEAKAEAAYFLSVIKGFKLTYPAVLDLEENKKSPSKKVLTDATVAFMDEVKNAGYTPMLYTGKSFLETQLDESRLKSYALWVARYGPQLGRTADIWQYSEQGKVSGISGNVDMNWGYRNFAPKPVVSKPKPTPTEVKPKPAAKPYQGSLLKNGSRGKNIELVQKVVGTKADGIYGPKTVAAVKSYQKAHGLTEDGIVGPKSWEKMFK